MKQLTWMTYWIIYKVIDSLNNSIMVLFNGSDGRSVGGWSSGGPVWAGRHGRTQTDGLDMDGHGRMCKNKKGWKFTIYTCIRIRESFSHAPVFLYIVHSLVTVTSFDLYYRPESCA